MTDELPPLAKLELNWSEITMIRSMVMMQLHSYNLLIDADLIKPLETLLDKITKAKKEIES